MSNPQKDIISIVTSDSDVFYYNEKALAGKFDVIKALVGDCPSQESIPLPDVSTKALELILAYTDKLETPDNNGDWIVLLQTADCLALQSKFNDMLLQEARKYLKIEGSANVALEDIIRKLQKPEYIIPQKCCTTMCDVSKSQHQEKKKKKKKNKYGQNVYKNRFDHDDSDSDDECRSRFDDNYSYRTTDSSIILMNMNSGKEYKHKQYKTCNATCPHAK